MISPTRTLVLLAAAAAPLALTVALAFPDAWTAGLAMVGVMLGLALGDVLMAPAPAKLGLTLDSPALVGVGERFELDVRLPRAAGTVEVTVEADGPVAPDGILRARLKRLPGGGAQALLPMRAERRGAAQLKWLWARTRGPLGLMWRQKRLLLDRPLLVTPDLRPTRQRGIALAAQTLAEGQIAVSDRGEASEFDALTDYRPGIDRRAIDWKQSARHTRLIAKEYRAERNNHIVMAIDCGRTMSEPMDGMPRMDSAVAAALLTAFVALRQGDRVGLFAFDDRPRASSKAVSGPAAFGVLQRVAGSIDYSTAEANYTLAFASLATSLKRRTLIVVFAEVSDTVSAELMLAALGPLLKKHLLLFVVLRDAELEAFTAAEPEATDDLVRAVTAAGLLRERRLVLARLKHLGVEVVEATAAETGPAVVDAYLDLKRRGRL